MKQSIALVRVLLMTLLFSLLLCAAYAEDTENTVLVSNMESALRSGTIVTVTTEQELRDAINDETVGRADLSGNVVITSDITVDVDLGFCENASLTIKSGNFTFTADNLYINDGYTVTVENGAVLSMTNNLVIDKGGTLNVYGSITGTQKLMLRDGGSLNFSNDALFSGWKIDADVSSVDALINVLNMPGVSNTQVYIYENLDITEEITVPTNAYITLMSKKLVFRKDSTLNLNGSINVDSGSSLIFEEGSSLNGVSGYQYSSQISVYGGNFLFHGTNSGYTRIYLSSNATYEGLEPFSDITISAETDDPSKINTILNRVDGIQVNLTVTTDMTVSENVTVPAGSSLYIYGNMTFSQGTKMITEENAHIYISDNNTLTVSLENNGQVTISRNGKLCIPEDGSYSGYGVLCISCSEEEAQNCLTGLSLSDFERLEYSSESYQRYRYNVGRIQLATPTDLEWGTCPSGSTAWNCEEPKQEQFYIEIYSQGTEDPLYSTHWSFTGYSGQHYSVTPFCTLDAETGDYYFTVKSVSSDYSYKDSGTAISPVWHYERPEAQLGACTNIQIHNSGWTFCMPEDTTYVGGYETVIYYAASEYDTPKQAGATSMLSPSNSYSSSATLDMTVYDYCLQQHGAGYYSFKIRTLSKDITAAVSGPWSEISPALYIGTDRCTLSFPNGAVEYTMDTTDNRLSATVGGSDPQTYYENYGSLIWKSSNPEVLSFTEEYGWSGSESSVKVQLNGVGTAYVTATTKDSYAVSAGNMIVVHSASPATVPADLKTIEAEAFDNTNFEEIVLQNGVVSIGSGAFKNCVNLKLITIPDSVTSIADDAFSGCPNVTILCSASSVAHVFAMNNYLSYLTIY